MLLPTEGKKVRNMLIGGIENGLIAQELQTLSLMNQICQAALARLAAVSASSSCPNCSTPGPTFEGVADTSPAFGNFLGALSNTARSQMSNLAGTTRAPAADSESVHITQVYDEKYNPTGAMRSADCGPTSLAMCLKGLGLGGDGGPQDRIDQARFQMFDGVDASRDGVDANGNKVQEEHSTTTNIEDVRRGAERMGAKCTDISNVDQVAQALEGGAMVALAGNNSGNIYGGGNGIDYNGGHFIAVSAYDRSTDTFTINDPLAHGGPIQVTRDQLRQYMWDQDGAGVDGLAISRA